MLFNHPKTVTFTLKNCVAATFICLTCIFKIKFIFIGSLNNVLVTLVRKPNQIVTIAHMDVSRPQVNCHITIHLIGLRQKELTHGPKLGEIEIGGQILLN